MEISGSPSFFQDLSSRELNGFRGFLLSSPLIAVTIFYLYLFFGSIQSLSSSNIRKSHSQFGSGRGFPLILLSASRKSELCLLNTTATTRRHWPFPSARFWFDELLDIVSLFAFSLLFGFENNWSIMNLCFFFPFFSRRCIIPTFLHFRMRMGT